MRRRSFVAFLIGLSLLAACVPGSYYQKNVSVPETAWAYDYKPTFTFEITDTNAVYRPYFLIRHTQAYPYNNIWIWLYITAPGDTIAHKARVNIPLAEASGKWMGRGMGEIYEQHMPIALEGDMKINRAGTYKVQIEQNMRVDPLPEVLNVGWSVHKVAPRLSE